MLLMYHNGLLESSPNFIGGNYQFLKLLESYPLKKKNSTKLSTGALSKDDKEPPIIIKRQFSTV